MLKGINPLLTPELLKLLCEMGRLNERLTMRDRDGVEAN